MSRAGATARHAERALASGRFADAAERFGEVLASSDVPVYRVKRGLALWEAGSRKEGMKEARAGSNGLPENHPARLFLALMLLEEGKLDESEIIVRSVTAADPENPFARGLTALASLAAGRISEAVKLLEAGVFGSSLFRAHLLVALEKHLKRSRTGAQWNEGYLEMVL